MAYLSVIHFFSLSLSSSTFCLVRRFNLLVHARHFCIRCFREIKRTFRCDVIDEPSDFMCLCVCVGLSIQKLFCITAFSTVAHICANSYVVTDNAIVIRGFYSPIFTGIFFFTQFPSKYKRTQTTNGRKNGMFEKEKNVPFGRFQEFLFWWHSICAYRLTTPTFLISHMCL